VAEPKEPEKLDYADPALEHEDQGARRYYREPPELEQLMVIGIVVVLVLVGLAALAVYLVRQGIGR
jgi:hypothetical protein